MSERDFTELDARFRQRFESERTRFDALAGSEISKAEKEDMALLARVAEQGLAEVLRRRPKSADTVELLVAAFVNSGPVGVLRPGPQRGGDFLNNQLRGRWAEDVVASMRLPRTVIVPVGPSGAAMPGEEDHGKITRAFAEIHLLEGKRPDLLGFDETVWGSFAAADLDRAGTWSERLLDEHDVAMVTRARFAVEVKNSAWHYDTRRGSGAGRGPLSITVKDEELATLTTWSERTGVPVLFVQVLFDEIYCMSYARMVEGKARGFVYSPGDHKIDHERKSGKDVNKFFVDGPPHLCGRVVFPGDSRAHVRILDDGSVVPYIEFAPALATDVEPGVFEREIGYLR